MPIMLTSNKYQCLICKVSYSTKYYLKAHEDGIHKMVKLSCQDCGKQFSQKNLLTTHINHIHKGIKYKCNICHKEFGSHSNRNKHVNSTNRTNILVNCAVIKQQHQVI